jgi:hypothetical protein
LAILQELISSFPQRLKPHGLHHRSIGNNQDKIGDAEGSEEDKGSQALTIG